MKNSIFDLDQGKSNSCSKHGHDRVEVVLLSGYSFQKLLPSTQQFYQLLKHSFVSEEHSRIFGLVFITSDQPYGSQSVLQILRKIVPTDIFLMQWREVGELEGEALHKIPTAQAEWVHVPQVYLANASVSMACSRLRQALFLPIPVLLTRCASRGPWPWFWGYQLPQYLEDLPCWHSAWTHPSKKVLPDQH